MKNSVLTYVINQLTEDKDTPVSKSNLDDVKCTTEVPVPISFYLCMANVLISACQKISDSGKKPFARRLFPVSFVPSRYSKLLNFHCFMICEVVLLNHASCHFIHTWCKTLQVITKSEIRAACTQGLFSAVYHLNL